MHASTKAWVLKYYLHHLHEEYLEGKIDILVVDGPPGQLQSLSRYPALPMIEKYLAGDVFIMIDDGHRADEEKIAKLWAQQLNADVDFDAKYFRKSA